MKFAQRDKTYCAGWASSPLCPKCALKLSKYATLRDIDYRMVDRGDKAPVDKCKNFVVERVKRG